MRCPKCGHSDDNVVFIGDNMKRVYFGDQFISPVEYSKPTLWQRLKTWWRA